MRHKVVLTLIFSLFLILISAYGNQFQAQPIKATVIIVNDVGDTFDTTPNDGICADAAGKCTLRAAIAESNARIGTDVIIFDIPVPAVITLTLGELQTTDSVSILGRGARRLTIQRSSSNSVSNFRIFHFVSFAHLRGVTVRNGFAGTGGGILAEAGLQLYDVTITGNRAVAGGGVSFQGSQFGETVLERCLINSNTASGQGGGLYIAPSMYVELKGSTITGNSAVAGGAVANYGWLISVNDSAKFREPGTKQHC